MNARTVLSFVALGFVVAACGGQVEVTEAGGGELETSQQDLAAFTQDVCQVADCTRPGMSQRSWRGDYFVGTGHQAFFGTRYEPAVDFHWADGAPMPGMPADNFSVRWTRQNYFHEGVYEFSLAADDGVRLYVDGHVVIDDWVVTATKVRTHTVRLSAGLHNLVVEYFEAGGAAVVQLQLRRADVIVIPPASDWNGAYYSGSSFEAGPLFVRADPAIDFNWGNGSPAPGVLPADHFSVRWTKTQYLTQGWYRVSTLTDDGVRVWVDGQPWIDAWRISAPFSEERTVYLFSGYHTFVVDYFEAEGGAQARVNVDPASPPVQLQCPGAWRGEYYPNLSFAGPGAQQCDATIDFNWGSGQPVPSVPADQFSVRWTRQVEFKHGNYTFHAEADDRMRVLVDGEAVVDFNTPNSVSVVRAMTAGTRTVTVEFADYGGAARARFRMDGPTDCVKKANILSCTNYHPTDSGAWVEVHRKLPNGSLELHELMGSIHPNGFVRFTGVPVDSCTYGPAGQPYVVKQFKGGTLQRQTELMLTPGADATMPASWGCPISDK